MLKQSMTRNKPLIQFKMFPSHIIKQTEQSTISCLYIIFFLLFINQRLKETGTMSTAAHKIGIMYHSTKPIL